MKIDRILYNLFYFIILIGFQIFVFRNFALFNYAFCYAYIGFILLLPVETPKVAVMLVAFGTGLLLDVFYDTAGINAAASVLVAFLRKGVVEVLTPKGGYDANTEVSVFSQGFEWFTIYAGLLILIHHLTLFFLEAWTLDLFFLTVIKAILSSIFTLIVVILFQYLIFSPKKYQ